MHRVDEHIGRKLKGARLASAHSMEVFAHKLGLSLNQYRRYERGESAMKCSLLVDIAAKLHLRLEHFVEGFRQDVADPNQKGGRKKAEWSQRIHDLAQNQPIGSHIRFPHGTLPSIDAAKRVISKAGNGKAAWADLRYTSTGTTIRKVAKP